MQKLIKDNYFKTWQSMLDVDIQQEFFIPYRNVL